MTRREWLQEGTKSVMLGLALFFSAVFVLLIDHDLEHLALFSDRLVLIIGGYILAVMLVRLAAALPFIQRFGEWAGQMFRGFAGVYWIGILLIPVWIAGSFMEQFLRYIFVANMLVLFSVYVGRYLYLRKIAEEMNRGRAVRNFVLLEDLERRPKDEDEFMEWVESYCRKSGLDYEIIQYGMPAQIRMDGVGYLVKITEYCSMASGIIPAMEFTVL